MTTYIGGGVAGNPSKSIEGVTAPEGDIDFISSDDSVTITGNDAGDTIDFVAANGAGLPVDDATAVVKGSVDATKLVRIEADGLTTGTTRVLTMPDSDTTIIDTGDSRLSDARTPTAHNLGGAEHTADTLANLNSKLSDATLTETEYNDGGEAGGANRSLGNTDAFDLQLLTSGLPRITMLANGRVGIGVVTPSATLQVEALTSTTIGICITEAVGQTSNLLEWRNSSGNLRGRIDSQGSFIVDRDSNSIILDLDADNAITLTTTGKDAIIKMGATGGTFDAFVHFDVSSVKWAFGFDDSATAIKLTKAATLGGANTAMTFLDNLNVGIGTESPQAKLEVGGTPGTSVGGFASGNLHVTGQSAVINANAVITGHNLFGGNKQLWYLGSASSSNDDILFINRQNASMSLMTNNATRLTIGASGDVSIGTTAAVAQLHVDQSSLTGAKSVLALDQADLDQGFVDYLGTSSADALSPISTLTTSGGTTHHLRIEINGANAWIAASTTDPS